MSVQLHRYTHEIINTLSVRKVLAAVLAVYFAVWGLIIMVFSANQNHALNAWYALALQGHNTGLCLKAH